MPPPLRTKRATRETQLAQIETGPQVVLHPGSIKTNLANVEALQDGLPTIVHDAPGSLA